jgi:UDP-N-acetylenolpyruvoylglucosamine reductase
MIISTIKEKEKILFAIVIRLSFAIPSKQRKKILQKVQKSKKTRNSSKAIILKTYFLKI